MTSSPSGAYRAPTGRDSAEEPERADGSLADLMGKISRDVSVLVRQELELAKAEARQEAVKSGKAAGLLGGAGVAVVMLLLFLSFALWGAFAVVMTEGLAALLVAVVWGTVAAVLYSTGRWQLDRLNPTPQRTTETLKDVPESVRGH
jgi:VIT1/CCC1 family predicted Fe2+/Mn2+ transporter